MLTLIQQKIQTKDTLSACLARWRLLEEKIVFTNGCFDLLHYGHLHYLAEARNLGNRLIVGLNSDESVRRLKGKHRPIQEEKSRSWLLAGLLCVDAVIVFEEDTPLRLIQEIQPDVLVKGGDYTIENIVGAEEVLTNGGTVKILPFQKAYSTTRIERHILKNHPVE